LDRSIGLLALSVCSCVLVAGCGADGPRWPLDGGTEPDKALSSPYGPRFDDDSGDFEFHRGIDLPADVGTDVHAIAPGRVSDILTDNADKTGLRVELCHAADGAGAAPEDCDAAQLFSFYAHLSEMDLKMGDVVGAGGKVGRSGTGTSGYAHLHFEIRTGEGRRGDAVHPFTVLPYEDRGAPEVEIVSVDTADPSNPIVEVAATVPAAELDLTAVEVSVIDAASGAVVDQRSLVLADWNRERTELGGDDAVHMAEADGIRMTPEPFQQGTASYRLRVTFLSLTGPADAANLRIEARAIDARGNAGTAVSP
jgi:hypothetical protein